MAIFQLMHNLLGIELNFSHVLAVKPLSDSWLENLLPLQGLPRLCTKLLSIVILLFWLQLYKKNQSEQYCKIFHHFFLMVSPSVFTNFIPILKGYKRKIKFPSSSVDKQFSQHRFEPTSPLHVFLASLSKVNWIKMGYFFILQPIPLINRITFIINFL